MGGIKPHLLNFAHDLSRKGYVTSVVDYGHDLQPIVDTYDKLKTLPEVDPKRIGMAGFSQGTDFTLQFVVAYPERTIRGSVNYYGFCYGCWSIGNANYPPLLLLQGDLDTRAEVDALVGALHKVLDVFEL